MMNNIDEGMTIRVYGTGSKGATFRLRDCCYAELLDDTGNVIPYWDTKLEFDELPY